MSDYLHGVGHHTDNLQEARAIIQGIDLAAHNLGVALVPQSAARFQRSGVLFKPLTDKLIQIETALFVRRDKMHGDVLEFVNAGGTVSNQDLWPVDPRVLREQDACRHKHRRRPTPG